MTVFCWKTLRKGTLVGTLGRVYLVRWEGYPENEAAICLRDEFDIAIPLEELQDHKGLHKTSTIDKRQKFSRFR